MALITQARNLEFMHLYTLSHSDITGLGNRPHIYGGEVVNDQDYQRYHDNLMKMLVVSYQNT